MGNRTLIKNAKIWTSDRKQPWADSILINGEDIEFVGTAEQAEAAAAQYSADSIHVIEAGGRMITPSFIDSHLHISTTALSMDMLWFQMRQFETFEELMEVVKAYADEHPKEEVPFINSYSCPSECMEREGVNRYLMDKYVSDRPVLVMDVNFHRTIVNSKMLELMEVDKNTPYDHESSMNYERFEDGTPTGIIWEHAHEFNHDIDKMYENMGWWPRKEDDPQLIDNFMQRVSDFGITGIHEGYTESDRILKALTELDQQGKLKQYVQCMPLMKDISCLDSAIETTLEWKRKYEKGHVYVNSIKIFLDGTLEIGTFASLDPFLNDPSGKNYGTLNIEEDDLTHAFEKFNQAGLDTQIHLVGDRAFRTALNAAERAQKNEKAAGREFNSKVVLMHCELTHPDDRKRPAELGVIVNANPGWMSGVFGDGAEAYIGKEKFDSLYSFNEMIRTGATVCFSSDITDEGGFCIVDPFYGMEVAHRRADDMFGSGIQRPPAEECVAIEDLLYGFTINNAIEMGIDHKTGSLEAGKKANLCILTENIFEVPENKIKDIKCAAVMFEGEVIRGKDNLFTFV